MLKHVALIYYCLLYIIKINEPLQQIIIISFFKTPYTNKNRDTMQVGIMLFFLFKQTLSIEQYTFFDFLSIMDVIKAIQHYADKMINDVPGMKALLLDTETVNVIHFSFF